MDPFSVCFYFRQHVSLKCHEPIICVFVFQLCVSLKRHGPIFCVFLFQATCFSKVSWSHFLCVCISGNVFLYYCSPVLKSLMAKVVSTLETTRAKRMSDLHLFYERAWWLVSILAQVCTGKHKQVQQAFTNSASVFTALN